MTVFGSKVIKAYVILLCATEGGGAIIKGQ